MSRAARRTTIVRRSVHQLSIPLREPFATAGGVVSARELLLLRIEDEDGFVGHGEAAPLEAYDGVPLDRAAEELASGRADLPQVRAAEEMAALDLAGRREARPLGEPGAEAIPVNRTLSGGPPDEVAARAAAGVREGFSCFKLKVGLPDDHDRVAAVRRAIGPWPALRLDANGAWAVEEAIARIRELAAHDLQLVEQPCGTLAELAAVRRAVSVPIAADEPIQGPADVEAAAAVGACDAVNVKLATCGGWSGARDALRTAARHDMRGYLSSTLDGPWGIAAGLQLAASERVTLACGLATLELFEARVARSLPPPRVGLQAVPEGPGLGIEVPADALDEVVVEEIA